MSDTHSDNSPDSVLCTVPEPQTARLENLSMSVDDYRSRTSSERNSDIKPINPGGSSPSTIKTPMGVGFVGSPYNSRSASVGVIPVLESESPPTPKLRPWNESDTKSPSGYTHNNQIGNQCKQLLQSKNFIKRTVSAELPLPDSIMNKQSTVGHNIGHHAQVETHILDKPKSFDFNTGTKGLMYFLSGSPHLYLLGPDELHYVASNILRREFDLYDDIIVKDQIIPHVYVVLCGIVDVFISHEGEGTIKPDNMPTINTFASASRQFLMEKVGTISPNSLFCIDAVVFDKPAQLYYRAGHRRTVLGLIPRKIFMQVLDNSVAMRQSIGRKLADHSGIFNCFKDFCRHVFSHESAKYEYLPLWHILDAYTRLNNSIHSKMNSSEIDVSAWGYAINRLPKNVTSTFCFDLVRALPPFLAKRMRDSTKKPDSSSVNRGEETGSLDVKFISTKERRRCSWQLGMDGKTLVLLRDSFTDPIDFITMLCIHIIESNKLRGRLQGMVHPPAIDIIDEVLHGPYRSDCASPSDTGSLSPHSSEYELKKDVEKAKTTINKTDPNIAMHVLTRMPLTEIERNGILKIWPNDCLMTLFQIIMHREEYMLRVEASIGRRFQTDPFHEWSLNLRAAVMKQMGLSPQGHLPDDLVVDIISSNTHSTKSCLSPFARRHRNAILEYTKKHSPDVYALNWPVEEDLVYAAISGYIAHNDLREEYNKTFKECGIEVMDDTAMTGLQVDIVPIGKIDMSLIDPLLTKRNCTSSNKRHFLLNMDFAFGAQADGITKTLVETFGSHIRSFSVMGKAGGIASSIARGDIQLASHVLFSKSSLIMEDYLDELRHCGNNDITKDFLVEFLGEGTKSNVLYGPVLTIPGTILQNEVLLKYYSNIWHCIGIEMEGSYFCRQIKESMKRGVLNESVVTRFAYYTSDLPFGGDTSLAIPMKPNEGIPPLYAITRAFLCRILNGQ
eukprot:Tbor_TRINITY_DN5582_c0_g2::TRINITY_DN5582_c0_g2_i1::g.12579::m.12579